MSNPQRGAKVSEAEPGTGRQQQSCVRLAQEGDLLERLQAELGHTEKAREDTFEKYAASRDQYKSEYENKLKDELGSIRIKRSAERSNRLWSSKEMYERENRMLREATDHAVLEKDPAVAAERQIESRYDQLLEQFRQLQLGTASQVVEASSQAKRQDLEVEQALLVGEETLAQHLVECEKQQKKLELLRQFSSLQRSAEKRLAMQAAKLEASERLEQELDQFTQQAAGIQHEEAERDLFSHDHDAHVPTATRRRLSLRLARRVVCLQRQNTSLKRELDSHRSHLPAEELLAASQVREQMQQPYSYVVEAVRQREAQIRA